MKKIFSIIVLSVFMMAFAACDMGGGGASTVTFTGVDNLNVIIGATFNAMDGVTATDSNDGDITSLVNVTGTVNTAELGAYTLTYRVIGSDGIEKTATRIVTVVSGDAPDEIVIMTGAVHEIDPFHENYSGTNQIQKQALQTAVEALYNVTIIYREYPANAPYGPDRVTAVINSSIAGSHLADIYVMNSDWLQQLASAEAIVSLNNYMATHGVSVHQSYRDMTTYKENIYGFSTGKVTATKGLYYNADLVSSLGVENPTQLFLNGEWTWSKFDTWATQVQVALTSLGEDYYALGGQPALYAEAMVPLNGGRLINALAEQVQFHQTPALDTYNFLQSLWTKGLFETDPQYDAGSAAWQAGKVAVHPGNLWFMTAINRWGMIPFEIGFVPYPVADDYTGDYISPASGLSVFTLASGMSAQRQEKVFEIWNALQLWLSPTELEAEFEAGLIRRFDDEKYVEAYMEIYDKVYLELVHAIGINPYVTPHGWYIRINPALKNIPDAYTGNLDVRASMEEIQPIYQAALDDYFD